MPTRERKSEYVLTGLAVLVIAAYLAVFTVIDFRGFQRLCTSDMYEDTLVARLMWEQKTLFPKNYLFGNQFYAAATPVLAALFYGLTGSMNRAMAWATLGMSALLLLSMRWMLRARIARPSLRAAAAVVFLASLFGPYTVFREDGQQLFFAMCSFYACYLICFFTVLGDWLRPGKRPLALGISMLLCFCMGMQSLRQTCVLILPLLACEALGALLRAAKKQAPFPAETRGRLWRAAAYTGANVLGLLFIRLLPVKRHEIYTGASVFSGAPLADKLRDAWNAILTVTGYEAARQGEDRLFFVLMFLTTTLLVLGAAWLLLKRRRRPDGAAAFWLVALVGCGAVIAASFVTSVRLRPIYLFLYYPLPALSLAVIGEKAKGRFLPVLTAGLCLLAAANLYFSYKDDLAIVFDPAPTPAEEIADWAVENGCELVYGSQSMCAPAVAACADGKLIAGCWQDDFMFKVSPLINIRDVYRIEDYKRAVFVFLDGEVQDMLAETGANGVEMTPRGQYGYYRVYTASAQCLWPVTELIDYAERYPEYN